MLIIWFIRKWQHFISRKDAALKRNIDFNVSVPSLPKMFWCWSVWSLSFVNEAQYNLVHSILSYPICIIMQATTLAYKKHFSRLHNQPGGSYFNIAGSFQRSRTQEIVLIWTPDACKNERQSTVVNFPGMDEETDAGREGERRWRRRRQTNIWMQQMVV